jgi:hypothetical protein
MPWLQNRVESYFNRHAWRDLHVQPLEQSFELPAEFKRVCNYRQFAALANPTTTLCTMPLALSPDPHAYVASLTAQDLKGEERTQETVAAERQLADAHTYRVRIAELASSKGQAPTPERVKELLTESLTDKPGRNLLIHDLLRQFAGVNEHIGPVSYYAIGIGMGWMPPPSTYAPHEDSRAGGIRVFCNLEGPGPLVVPSTVSEKWRRIIATPFGDDEPVYTAYTPFAQMGVRQTYVIPRRSLSAWRVLDRYDRRPNGPALAHATPPVIRRFRPHVVMNVQRPVWPGFRHV